MKSLICFAIIASSSFAFADTFVIETDGNTFSPDVVEVAVGDTIRWERTAGTHTATSGAKCMSDGLFDGELSAVSPVFEWVVPEGVDAEIPYFCTPHCGMGMTGTIYVASPTTNAYALKMLHASGGIFEWNELGGGSNSWDFVASTNTSQFSMEFVIDGEIEFTDVVVSGVADVYTISGGPAPSFISGTVTFPEGHYVITMNTAPNQLHFVTPGASSLRGSDTPLWNYIYSQVGDVHWQHRNNQLVYEFTSGALSTFSATLNNSSDTTEECFWYGGITPLGIVLPTEGEQGGAVIPSGISHIYGDGIYRLVFTFGDAAVVEDPLPEDLNGDGVVGLADLLMIIAAWGATSP
jgi:plastocyanin